VRPEGLLKNLLPVSGHAFRVCGKTRLSIAFLNAVEIWLLILLVSGHAFTGHGKIQSSMTVLKGGSKSGFCRCPYQGTPSGVPQSDRIRGRFSGGLCDETNHAPRLKAHQMRRSNGTPEGVP
jgi:hypothetical protein